MNTEAAARRNADPRSVAFVTGANRGIGLEVTRQLLERAKGERDCCIAAGERHVTIRRPTWKRWCEACTKEDGR